MRNLSNTLLNNPYAKKKSQQKLENIFKWNAIQNIFIKMYEI